LTERELLLLVGAKVAKLRFDAGLTQVEFAKKALGTSSPSTLSAIELGKTDMRLSTLVKIAEFLNVPLTDFFEE
jgi:transcriptional regulator with XRE-family HTH domain